MDRTNTHIVIAIFAATTVLLVLCCFGIIFTIIYKRKQQGYLNETRLLKATFQEQLLQASLEIKEHTLQHIAHELHDNLGQVASLIKINLNTIQIEDYASTRLKIEDTKELVRQLIYDLKLLSVNLSSDRIVQIGIVKNIEQELDRIKRTGQFDTNFSLEGQMPVLDSSTAIILFRMVQELLNNAMKHSGAKFINIYLLGSENLFTLVCSDDGCGFDLEAKRVSGGLGLLNLESRARLINAKITTISLPSNGTTVSIELPVKCNPPIR